MASAARPGVRKHRTPAPSLVTQLDVTTAPNFSFDSSHPAVAQAFQFSTAKSVSVIRFQAAAAGTGPVRVGIATALASTGATFVQYVDHTFVAGLNTVTLPAAVSIPPSATRYVAWENTAAGAKTPTELRSYAGGGTPPTVVGGTLSGASYGSPRYSSGAGNGDVATPITLLG